MGSQVSRFGNRVDIGAKWHEGRQLAARQNKE
jgi:hypothetical protein